MYVNWDPSRKEDNEVKAIFEEIAENFFLECFHRIFKYI